MHPDPVMTPVGTVWWLQIHDVLPGLPVFALNLQASVSALGPLSWLRFFEIYFFFWWNHQILFKMVHFSIKTQNLEFVNLKCVIYAHSISLSMKSMNHQCNVFLLLQVSSRWQESELPSYCDDIIGLISFTCHPSWTTSRSLQKWSVSIELLLCKDTNICNSGIYLYSSLLWSWNY